MGGKSQREIAAKLKIPARTVAHWSKTDGWEDERRARKIAGETENVAAIAAEVSPAAANSTSTAANNSGDAIHIPDVLPPEESRSVGMDRVLKRQQRITGRLVEAFERDLE